jgi:hypothetical protein
MQELSQVYLHCVRLEMQLSLSLFLSLSLSRYMFWQWAMGPSERASLNHWTSSFWRAQLSRSILKHTTFQLVAYCLNQLHYRMPHIYIIQGNYLSWKHFLEYREAANLRLCQKFLSCLVVLWISMLFYECAEEAVAQGASTWGSPLWIWSYFLCCGDQYHVLVLPFPSIEVHWNLVLWNLETWIHYEFLFFQKPLIF